MMRMAVGVMIRAVCVIIVSHYTGISRSSTGVLLLLLQLLLLLLQTYIAATIATGAFECRIDHCGAVKSILWSIAIKCGATLLSP